MLGAIIGDIAGSRFEWNNHRSKEFDLFGNDDIAREACFRTDDSVMTIAVADAIMKIGTDDEPAFKEELIDSMHKFGRADMDAGYGGHFYRWLLHKEREPYNSFGNGSAMRCAPAGWVAESLEDAIRIGRLTAEVTHNHPEGIKGAECTAAAIYLARTGSSKEEIKLYIENNYYPDAFKKSIAEIRPTYEFNETCQETVPQALVAFIESTDFEDSIKTAVSVGGDSDTLACITGAVAEAFYGIPQDIAEKALQYLEGEELEVTKKFVSRFCSYK